MKTKLNKKVHPDKNYCWVAQNDNVLDEYLMIDLYYDVKILNSLVEQIRISFQENEIKRQDKYHNHMLCVISSYKTFRKLFFFECKLITCVGVIMNF